MELGTLEPELRKRYEADPKGLFEWLARVFTGDSPPEVESDPVATTAKGYALCIGLDHVDPERYGGWDGELPSCRNDARRMQQELRKVGFEDVELLLDDEATRSSVVYELNKVAERSKAGDTVVVYYSGHGGQVPELGSSLRVDEADKLDETWCLYDGQLLDDEIAVVLSRIHPGARVIVIADGCHSGTITKSPRVDKPKAMPVGVIPVAYEVQESIVKAAQGRLAGTTWYEGKGPTVVTLAACREDEVAYAGLPHSQFTGALLHVWDGGDFEGDWRKLHAGIVRRVKTDQSPQLTVDGPAWREALRWPAMRI